MKLELAVPDDVLEQIVEHVIERVKAELAEASPWMTRKQAACYLGVPVSRLEKDRRVPCHRWEGRVMYHRSELDAWLMTA